MTMIIIINFHLLNYHYLPGTGLGIPHMISKPHSHEVVKGQVGGVISWYLLLPTGTLSVDPIKK